jgi:CBS domain-containing protein
MLRQPVVVTPETDILNAVQQILINRISGVTVVEDGRPVGVLSELDCLRAILWATYHAEAIGTHPVRDHMSTPVETVHPDDDMISVAQSMLDHKRRRRPVVDRHGRMVGQLTCRQILRVIRDFDVPPAPRGR